jgi:hypothetical protein
MISKPLNSKENHERQRATVLSPGDFPLGSPQSRAAARFWLLRVGVAGESPSDCICFPENEPPFFGFPSEEEAAATVKCPLHGNRFKQTTFQIYVPKWRRESEPIRRQRLSAQYQKAWLASFPPESGPAEKEETSDGRLSET